MGSRPTGSTPSRDGDNAIGRPIVDLSRLELDVSTLSIAAVRPFSDLDQLKIAVDQTRSGWL